jgi:hypothetical protein
LRWKRFADGRRRLFPASGVIRRRFHALFSFLLPIWPLTILLTWSLLPRIKIKVSGKLARFGSF